MFIELSYILSSLWLDQPYGHWTALTFVLLVLALSSAEIAIVTCYFLLCSEVRKRKRQRSKVIEMFVFFFHLLLSVRIIFGGGERF